MKKYTIEDLKLSPLDVLGWLRGRRAWFFGGNVTAAALTGALRDEVVALGVAGVGEFETSGWHVVGADRDWLREGRFPLSDEETFRRMVALPELGPNTLRIEVLIAAFARDVVTISCTGALVIEGTSEGHDELKRQMIARGWARLVAFRMDDGAEPAAIPDSVGPESSRPSGEGAAAPVNPHHHAP